MLGLIASSSILYLGFFFTDISVNKFERLDSGFTDIVITDTIKYYKLASSENLNIALIIASIKNALVPSIIWFLADLNWYYVLLINLIMHSFILLLIQKNLELFLVTKRGIIRAMLVYSILPATTYYSIGALKEIPQIMLLLAIVYFSNTNRLVFLFLTVLCISIVRYQLIVFLPFILLSLKFRNGRVLSLAVLFAGLMFYPLFASTGILEYGAVKEFRALNSGGIGRIVEDWRENYIIISLIAVLIRAVQSLAEPLLILIGNPMNYFYFNGYIEVFNIIQLSTFIILSPYIYFLIFRMPLLKSKCLPIQFRKPLFFLFGFILTYLILVGGLSFIHHRYIYPVLPLCIVLSIALKESVLLKKVSSKQGA